MLLFNKDKYKINEERYLNEMKLKFLPNDEEDFDRILLYLTRKINGDIITKRAVKIKSNSFDNFHFPSNSVDFDNDEIFFL